MSPCPELGRETGQCSHPVQPAPLRKLPHPCQCRSVLCIVAMVQRECFHLWLHMLTVKLITIHAGGFRVAHSSSVLPGSLTPVSLWPQMNLELCPVWGGMCHSACPAVIFPEHGCYLLSDAVGVGVWGYRCYSSAPLLSCTEVDSCF